MADITAVSYTHLVLAGEAEKVQSLLTNYLKQTISIRDTYVRKEKKENLPTGKATTKETKEQSPSVCFYQGILLGLLDVYKRQSRKRLESSGFQLDKRVIQHEPLGFHDYNCLQMNAFVVVSDSGTLPEEDVYKRQVYQTGHYLNRSRLQDAGSAEVSQKRMRHLKGNFERGRL